MAITHFMSPHCNEAVLIDSFNPATPQEHSLMRQKVVARRLLLELRALIHPQESWNTRDEMAALEHDAGHGVWTVRDSTGLWGGYKGQQSIPGGIVSIEATLVTLRGELAPATLTIEQAPSMAGQPFMTLRGESADKPLKTEFDFPAKLDSHPLDALQAVRGDFSGKPLRFLLNRYDS